jgi:hypothetical protein
MLDAGSVIPDAIRDRHDAVLVAESVTPAKAAVQKGVDLQ